jgi:hypothetical protein
MNVARAIEKNIDWTYLLCQSFDGCRIGHIELASPASRQGPHLGFVNVGRRNVGAFANESFRSGTPDAACCGANHSDFSTETLTHTSSQRLSPAAEIRFSFLFEGLPPLSCILGGETDGLEIALILDRILPIHRVDGA